MKTDRIAFGLGIVALAGVLALMAYHAVNNPMDKVRHQVDAELAEIKTVSVAFPAPEWEFDKWHHEIVGKASLWKELVPEPAPPPPPPEKPPDLQEKLKGVEPTRQQVGGRVKIKTPGDEKGSFYSVGDILNGLQIKEISKTHVTFMVLWKDKELTTQLERR
ncbi:MAG TPA: hypothetical protein PLO37_00525 [Candidatus Hydrogenedentes bacterium]|nr:hypothetical protein [Candidatus Hydrogenedentota bacterium]HPG65298.1 hypothetical protein [Candidatus Hydrogenedentota bacterium]